MTEAEYIKIRNLERLLIARDLISMVLPSDKYEIDAGELDSIWQPLQAMVVRLQERMGEYQFEKASGVGGEKDGRT